MKLKSVTIFLFMLSYSSFGQLDTLRSRLPTINSPQLEVHNYMPLSCICDLCRMGGQNIMCIGRNAYFPGSSHHIVILGNFNEPVHSPPYTVLYDRNFWYFKTKKGKRLLRYLDVQSVKKRDKKRILIIQEHIMKYYISDIEFRLRLYSFFIHGHLDGYLR